MSFKKQVYKAQAGNPQHQVVPMADLIKPQKQPSYTPIAEAFDLEPIPDLKPGENLRWKSPQHKNLRWPALDQTLTVKSVVLPSLSRSPYDPLMRGDFTALLSNDDDGTVSEYSFESSRFVRA